MRVWTQRTIDIETGAVLSESYFDYDGPVCLAKGESKSAAKAAEEQRKLNNQLMQEQLAMQRNILNTVSGGVGQFLSPEGEGFDDATLAALRGQAIDSIPAQFEDARKRLALELTRKGGMGGNLPVSGDFLKGLGAFEAEREKTKAGMLRDVTIQDAIQKLQNRFNSANALLGVGAQFDPSQFTSGAANALSSRVLAARTADQPGFFGQLGNAFAGGLGQGLGEGVSAGIGKLFKP